MTLKLVPSDTRSTLQAQLADLARQDVEAWMKALDQIHDLSLLIASNEAQPVGIRELARALTRPVEQTSLNAQTIIQRAR